MLSRRTTQWVVNSLTTHCRTWQLTVAQLNVRQLTVAQLIDNSFTCDTCDSELSHIELCDSELSCATMSCQWVDNSLSCATTPFISQHCQCWVVGFHLINIIRRKYFVSVRYQLPQGESAGMALVCCYKIDSLGKKIINICIYAYTCICVYIYTYICICMYIYDYLRNWTF